MSACVKVQGIGDVVIAGNRVAGRGIHILGPGGCTDNNQVVRVNRTDRANHGFCIRLDDIVPADLQRFVVDFVNDIVVTTVQRGHFLEKSNGFGLIAFCLVGMEIDDNVEVFRDCRIDNRAHSGDISLGVSIFMAWNKTAVKVNAQGGANDGCIPVIFKPANGFSVVEAFLAPAGIAPEEAVTGKAFRLPATEYLIPAYRQRRNIREGSRGRKSCGGERS